MKYLPILFKKRRIIRDKVIKNVNKFADIGQMSDDEIIKLVQSDNLDVAIDLSGYTKNNKSHLFHHNISKIKINYLGYPGSMEQKNMIIF